MFSVGDNYFHIHLVIKSFFWCLFQAAFFIERLAELFDKLHKSNKDSFGQGKECYNVIALFSHLCNFKVCVLFVK